MNPKVTNLMKEKEKKTSQEEKERLDHEIGQKLMKEKYELIEKEINKVKENKASHQSQVFQIRRKILNNADKLQVEAIEDPESKCLLIDKNEIKQVTLEYASGTLQNNHPTPKFIDVYDTMRENHEIRRKRKGNSTDDILSKEDFMKEVKSFKEKGKSKYKEITEAGEGFVNSVFEFFKLIWESEKIPLSWNLTTLVQIFKRGNRSSLSSYRFVHL